jgi:hypothetical protein
MILTDKYISILNQLNNSTPNRLNFHHIAGEVLIEMANEKEFWFEIFKQNLTDKGYLGREWSMYDIPFFYVYENDDFYVKVHLFVPLKSYEPNIMASAIHHHNNYLITTYAAFGSGYETFLFEKDFKIDPITKEVNLKVRDHFTQQERPVHTVDAWEPHVVINPTSLSATLVIWSPDKKRATDSLRSNPLLKFFKTPIRKIIYLLGLDKNIGISAKETYQFYPHNSKYFAIPENEYFAPTRAQVGAEVDDYSIQTVFAFMQRMGFNDKDFLTQLKSNADVPHYYHKWINMMINDDPIPDAFAKEQINVPGGRRTVDDILSADKNIKEKAN